MTAAPVYVFVSYNCLLLWLRHICTYIIILDSIFSITDGWTSLGCSWHWKHFTLHNKE